MRITNVSPELIGGKMNAKIGDVIAINRFPHSGKSPTHKVVGIRDDGYLAIRPLNVSDDVLYARNPLGKGRIHMTTYLPQSDAIVFEKEGDKYADGTPVPDERPITDFEVISEDVIRGCDDC